MKPPTFLRWGGRRFWVAPPAIFFLFFFACWMLHLEGSRAFGSTKVVTSLADSGPGSLRQTMAEALPGDSVAFTITGTITLTNGELRVDKDLTILGPGAASLGISGNHAGRVFMVDSGVTALISGLTIFDGKASDGEPGSVIDGYPMPGGPGQPGGAIYNMGTLSLHDCHVTSSAAGNGGFGITVFVAVSAGGPGGSGGAICSIGDLTLSHCVVAESSAGSGGVSGSSTYSPMSGKGGAGGGIYATGMLRLEDSTVSGNMAGHGGDTPLEAPGADGGAGGGVFSAGTLIAQGSVIRGNAAGRGGHGGGDSLDAGAGGQGGAGGGIWSGSIVVLTNCTVSGNSCGRGGDGGSGYLGDGGSGGNGGSGGGIRSAGSLTLVNCTLGDNACGQGGIGGSGHGGMGFIWYAPNGTDGAGGGVSSEAGATVECLNTLIAGNAGTSPDAQGVFASLGYNLVSITNGSGGFTNLGDQVGSIASPLDPSIGSLADNGGPTLTMALLPGSPAVDAGTLIGAPTVDQRGMARPQGLGVDIGAIESIVHYVDANSTNAEPPYLSWATAATNIQDAVDVAAAGEQVVVTNGHYATGGRVVGTNLLLNRVVVDKALTLRSVNGPQGTVIQGHQLPGIKNGDGAIRCAYLVNGARLSGFTLAGGATRYWSANYFGDQIGGGARCESETAQVSNCVILSNSAYASGGGGYGGTIINCMLSGNSAADGAGASSATLNGCELTGNSTTGGNGGGAAYSTLNECALIDNSATAGGGAYDSTLNNCTLRQNRADRIEFPSVSGGTGGGAFWCTLNNCSVVDNAAYYGGGAYGGDLNNCALSHNSAWVWDNGDPAGPYGGEGDGAYASVLNSCILNGYNYSNSTNCDFNDCWQADPLFVDYAGGNLRLQSNSPCINAGKNLYAPGPTDLDGNPRIIGAAVDIGAYEFQWPASLISYAWLQQYGLPTDGSADALDGDCDGLNTWEEWRCLTCPTNALSLLRMLSATPAGSEAIVRWQSEPGVSYFIERSTNLAASPQFRLLATNLAGPDATATFTDTNAYHGSPVYYRVGVAP